MKKFIVLTLCYIILFNTHTPTSFAATPVYNQTDSYYEQRQLLMSLIAELQALLKQLESQKTEEFIPPLAYPLIITKKDPPDAVHYGVRIGSKVFASASGEVTKAATEGWNGGFAKHIVLDHGDGVSTLYAHLSHVGVEVGDTVLQGDVIGYSGDTGYTTGPVLYFKVQGADNPFVE